MKNYFRITAGFWLITGHLLVLAGSFPFPASGQLPRSDIYLFDLDANPGGWQMHRPRCLSPDWGPGYHNHPWFAGEDILLLSSDAANTGTPDLWELDLKSLTRRRLSAGPAAYFSPRRMPGTTTLTAISLEPDSRQFLQRCIEPSGLHYAPILPDQNRAGYYAWRDSQYLALFVVGEPHELWGYDLATDAQHLICLHPGRQFLFDDRGTLHYLHKIAPEAWYLKTWDPKDQYSAMVVRAVDGAEDFCLLPDGTYLMTSGAVIWQFHPQRHLRWQPLADLSVYHLHHLTRISHFQGRKLVLVNQWP